MHHTHPEREWAYDRTSPVGRLERGLDEALKRGWILVDFAPPELAPAVLLFVIVGVIAAIPYQLWAKRHLALGVI